MKNDKRQPVKIKSKAGLKIYRKNPYLYKIMYEFKTNTKKVAAIIGVGVVVLSGIGLMVTRNAFGIEPADEASVVITNDESGKEGSFLESDSNANVDKKQDILDIDNNDTKSYVEAFLQSPTGDYIYKYSEMYGVDPNIIAAICMQESSLEHYECLPEHNGISEGSMYNGYGVGIMQLESPSGEAITCYNYSEKTTETDYITLENACDIEKNIKLGCMIFQNSLQKNNGNLLMAIQSHNYGQGMMEALLSDAYGVDSDVKKTEYNNTEWIEYVKKAHSNPQIYVSDWSESTYGDADYLSHVLSHCPSNLVKYKYGYQEYTFDISSLKVVGMEEYLTKIM